METALENLSKKDLLQVLSSRDEQINWAVPQATAKKYGVEGLTNQPWNLMTFPNQSLHMRAGHGMNYLGQPGYGALGQFWYGTPTWFKAGMFSGGGRIID